MLIHVITKGEIKMRLTYKHKVAIYWILLFSVWCILTMLFSKTIRENTILSLIMIFVGMFFMLASPFVGLWIVKGRIKYKGETIK